MALNVTALADFNNQLAGELIAKMVYTGTTMEYVTVKEGIKFKEPINLFEVDVDVQVGVACVATPAGTASFSQRDIEVCQRTSFDGLCLKTLDKKYLGISTLGAGSYNETFTLATTYADLIVNQFQKSNEQAVWTGVSGSSCGAVGLKTVISGSTAGLVGSASLAAAGVTTGLAPLTGSTALTQLDQLIANIPTDVANREDLVMFMSVSNFRKFVSGIRVSNSYYFDPNSITNRGGVLDMMYPFENVRVVGTVGLEGSQRIVLGPAKQIVVGTDLMSDLTEFQMWYDINADQLKHRLTFKLGQNIAYPEFWVSNDLA